MRVTILGSGTLLPDDARRSPAHLVEGKGFRLLLDCGSGTVHGAARHGVEWAAVTHVALSHFHTDHTGDLAPLLWALKHGVHGGRKARLTLVGPRGLRGILAGLVRAHGEFVLEPGFPVRVVELDAGADWREPGGAFELRTRSARHTPEALAFRIEAEGASVGYTGDTGPDARLGRFFRGVDLLVSECALPDAQAMDMHLSPRSAAALLQDAEPSTAVLTHTYPGVDRGSLADLVRAHGFRGEVLVGYDGLRLEVPGPRGRRGAAREKPPKAGDGQDHSE